MSGSRDRGRAFEERLDRESRLLLEELWATPVGRRIDPALGVAEPSLSRFDPTDTSSLVRRRARAARRLRGRPARPVRP
jgi:hypothetical protein